MEVEPPLTTERELSSEAVIGSVVLKPWRDELVEAHGFGPRSMYVETCWLPVLGPSATWLYRRLGSWAEFNTDGTIVNLPDLGQSIGLGLGTGPTSPLLRSLGRLVRFGAARWDNRELAVRTALPPLTEHQAQRLSESTQRLHAAYTHHPNGVMPGRSS